MWTLPTSLRARLAVVALLGVFLIPLTTSSLRGLTHVLTCEDRADAPLYIDNSTGDDTVLLSADTVTGEDAEGLCGGLFVDLELASADDDRAEVVVTVTNGTEDDWQGTIELDVEGTGVPLAIGEIRAGEARTDTIELRIDPERDYEIEATLLVGP